MLTIENELLFYLSLLSLVIQRKMDEIYKVASTERVQQVEKELATQLIELETEIEAKEGLQETVYW